MQFPLSTGLVSQLAQWLSEDVGRGDRTTEALVPHDLKGRARIEARSEMVVAGLEVARACFWELDPALQWTAEAADGDSVTPMTVIARVSGPLSPIFTAERTALNVLGRLSGIATAARAYAAAVEGTRARVADTRKTTPGLRSLEKYAVSLGGGVNHRFGLDDGILIKDNHLAVVGGVSEAVSRARANAPHPLKVEVEVQDIPGLKEALEAGADAVLLDNMPVEEVSDAVALAGGRALLEVSGGVTLENIREYAETGVDLISVGAITHSAPCADVSLEVEA